MKYASLVVLILALTVALGGCSKCDNYPWQRSGPQTCR